MKELRDGPYAIPAREAQARRSVHTETVRTTKDAMLFRCPDGHFTKALSRWAQPIPRANAWEFADQPDGPWFRCKKPVAENTWSDERSGEPLTSVGPGGQVLLETAVDGSPVSSAARAGTSGRTTTHPNEAPPASAPRDDPAATS